MTNPGRCELISSSDPALRTPLSRRTPPGSKELYARGNGFPHGARLASRALDFLSGGYSMRHLSCFLLLLPISMAACGPQVTVDGSPPGDSSGSAGGGGGVTSVDEITTRCAAVCDGLEPPCHTGVNCTKTCSSFVAVAATSDVCAEATAAMLDCIAQWSEANECTQSCPAAEAFKGCSLTWCGQNPAPCAANMGP
jgi:hypothetical protein